MSRGVLMRRFWLFTAALAALSAFSSGAAAQDKQLAGGPAPNTAANQTQDASRMEAELAASQRETARLAALQPLLEQELRARAAVIERQRALNEQARQLRESEESMYDRGFWGSLRPSAGTPGACDPDPSASLPTNFSEEDYRHIMDRLDSCYYSLASRADPYMNRRSVYNGVASFGALGAAIGGTRAAVSTTTAWGGLAILPALFEQTVDRPEFDALDRVTVRGLYWFNDRALQMEAMTQDLDAHGKALICARDALQRARLGGDREHGAACADWGDVDESLTTLRRRLANGDADVEDGDPAPEASQTAADSFDDLLERLDNQLGEVSGRVAGMTDAYQDSKGRWAYDMSQQIFTNYDNKRRLMTPRPQTAARSILALPLSTLANIIRGGQNIQDSDYFGAIAAADLAGINASMPLPGNASDLNLTDVTLDLANFAEADQDNVRAILGIAQAARAQGQSAISSINQIVAGNAIQAPNFASSLASSTNTPPQSNNSTTPPAGPETGGDTPPSAPGSEAPEKTSG